MQIRFRGFTFDPRTIAMIKWAEKRAKFTFTIKQGSYHPGVGASAGTHDGGGAVDFAPPADPVQRETMLIALKDAGFAAWHRAPLANVWGEHIHAVAFGCKDLATVARHQLVAFDNGHDGLKDNGPDDHSYRPEPPVTFSLPLLKPIKRK